MNKIIHKFDDQNCTRDNTLNTGGRLEEGKHGILKAATDKSIVVCQLEKVGLQVVMVTGVVMTSCGGVSMRVTDKQLLWYQDGIVSHF